MWHIVFCFLSAGSWRRLALSARSLTLKKSRSPTVVATCAATNDAAVTDGSRIFSSYRTSAGTKLWVITEADRSSTCILLPEDY